MLFAPPLLLWDVDMAVFWQEERGNEMPGGEREENGQVYKAAQELGAGFSKACEALILLKAW